MITAGAYPTELAGRFMRSEGAVSRGRVTIGDDVWIGTGAMVLGASPSAHTRSWPRAPW